MVRRTYRYPAAITARRDQILAALRDAPAGKMTTGEVCGSVCAECERLIRTIGHNGHCYGEVYRDLKQLARDGRVQHYPPAGPVHAAYWSLSTVLDER